MTAQVLKGMMAVGLVAALSVPLVAHHSISAEFDTSKPITFTGKVTKPGSHGSLEWAVAWMVAEDGFSHSYCTPSRRRRAAPTRPACGWRCCGACASMPSV